MSGRGLHRCGDKIRIISVRVATRRERKDYEEGSEVHATRTCSLSTTSAKACEASTPSDTPRARTSGSSPDVAEFFPDSEAVNAVLRALVDLARKSTKKAII